MRTVSELKEGEGGVISAVEDGNVALKLMEMGCLPGEEIRVEHSAPLGDPMAIKVSGYTLSIRKDEAAFITLLN